MAVDFALDEDFKMVIKNGEFVLAESELTESQLIILSAKGTWKQWPLCGVNIRDYLGAPLAPMQQANLMREIRLQLEADGKKNIGFKTEADGSFSLKLK